MADSKKVLVTGGAGFVGSHLCESLIASGHHVTCVDNFQTGWRANIAHLMRSGRFVLIEQDVTNPPPANLRVDEIFHLACAASPRHYQADPVHTMMTCVLGTKHYLELARLTGARFLLASTSEIYGDPDVHPQPETYNGAVNPNGPRACYDEGKRAAEALACDYGRTHGVEVRIARIFNTYGPRMRADDGRVVSNFITQALAGDPITLYGDGSQTRSFCYVGDMVRGLRALMDSSAAEPVNLGNPAEYTIAGLAQLIMTLAGRKTRLVTRPLPQDDPRRRRPDIARAGALLGWKPQIAPEEGLAETIRYFRNAMETARRRQSAAADRQAAAL